MSDFNIAIPCDELPDFGLVCQISVESQKKAEKAIKSN